MIAQQAARAAARVGATAIHEKPLARVPAEALSALLHGAFGIDHYGGLRYLNKLDDGQLEQLQQQLAANLRLVQDAIDGRAALRASAPRIHPPPLPPVDELLSAMNRPLLDALGPFVRDAGAAAPALQSPPSSRAIGAVMRHLTEEADGVYSFELFSPALVERILAAGHRFAEAASDDFLQAGAQRNQVIMRYEPSLAALERELLARVVAPLGRVLFPDVASNISFGHGYLVGYAGATGGSRGSHSSTADSELQTSSGPAITPVVRSTSASTADAALADAASPSSSDAAAMPMATGMATSAVAADPSTAKPGAIPALLSHSGLRPHTDDSEVTLNVSLGLSGMVGGELVLRGRRNSTSEGSAEAVIAVRAGRAIVHAGQHLHEVRPVTAGERYALILWGRDDSYRARTCPCCLINRRNARAAGTSAAAAAVSGAGSASGTAGASGSAGRAGPAAAPAVVGDCICDAAFN